MGHNSKTRKVTLTIATIILKLAGYDPQSEALDWVLLMYLMTFRSLSNMANVPLTFLQTFCHENKSRVWKLVYMFMAYRLWASGIKHKLHTRHDQGNFFAKFYFDWSNDLDYIHLCKQTNIDTCILLTFSFIF